eukprot:2067457-Amphidinium_carterae.1
MSCPTTLHQSSLNKKCGNCHICGQPGHWIAECPHKKSFVTTSQDGSTWTDHMGHFHTVTTNMPGQTGSFLAVNAENEEDEVIQFGTSPPGPGDSCDPPSYVYV